MLFDKQPNFSRDELITYATQVWVDVTKFTACLDSRAKTAVVRADIKAGDQRGVRGTPTFYLNGELVSDWSKLKELIQAKLVGG